MTVNNDKPKTKSAQNQAWLDAADQLLEALARDNRFIVGEMLQIFLESANYGLDDYSPLGGVFRRAAARGIITRVNRKSKQALWSSNIYAPPVAMSGKFPDHIPDHKGKKIMRKSA